VAGETAETAASPGEGKADAEKSADTIYALIMKGGFLMVPIALCSIIVLTVAIERLISLRQLRTAPPGLLEQVFDLLPPGRPPREIQARTAKMLRQTASLLGNILEIGVVRVHRSAAYTEAFLQEATAKEAHLLHRRLRPFAAVAQLAPLLGLLGTIYGMIQCFGEAAAADAATRAETLAQGIYQALVTTAAGLTVAIPSLFLFHYFQGRADRVVDQLEEATTSFLDRYYGEKLPSRQRQEPAAAAPARGEP
jgi:biopolymer transport protein ExbB